jgi:hypothetical protein
MSTDAQPVASSATPETPAPVITAVDRAVASNDVSAYREARRAERSGTPLDAATESSPVPPEDQAASTDASSSPASEPGKPHKGNAETRVKELLAERARERERAERAERRLAELEAKAQPADAKPAESSPAAAPDTFPTYDAYLTTHPDASYEQYLDERADFRVEQKLRAERAAAEHASRAARETDTVRERDERFRSQVRFLCTPRYWNEQSL